MILVDYSTLSRHSSKRKHFSKKAFIFARNTSKICCRYLFVKFSQLCNYAKNSLVFFIAITELLQVVSSWHLLVGCCVGTWLVTLFFYEFLWVNRSPINRVLQANMLSKNNKDGIGLQQWRQWLDKRGRGFLLLLVEIIES